MLQRLRFSLFILLIQWLIAINVPKRSKYALRIHHRCHSVHGEYTTLSVFRLQQLYLRGELVARRHESRCSKQDNCHKLGKSSEWVPPILIVLSGEIIGSRSEECFTNK